jgi:hypothetical protein
MKVRRAEKDAKVNSQKKHTLWQKGFWWLECFQFEEK